MKKSKFWTDQEILEEISGAKQINEAIHQLYKGYYGLLENYVLQNNGSNADAADTIQETMLVFLNMIETGKFRKEASIKSVLYGINRNIWLTTLRKRKSRDHRHGIYDKEQEQVEFDVSKSLAEMEGYQLIMALFEKLGEKCKRILVLFYYENLSMDEIALREEYSSDQVVRNKKFKCMKQLTNQLVGNRNLYEMVRNALKDGK
ncbi:sigma-70 family RNA polymerase sigma factor [Cyclobacterium sp.]|uniref:RNA polymerase sigma factor n=1 Tax=Cyclobacterium sp. TaxID=1966343 RepID=UPI00198E8B94|nr:sigma-70 family RNA polymerase sigma factor [Cyclobacterium sp.]MBD3627279.1 sigma-70 family RNA polymerase sigma factor [Cyclobacterium sp.]